MNEEIEVKVGERFSDPKSLQRRSSHGDEPSLRPYASAPPIGLRTNKLVSFGNQSPLRRTESAPPGRSPPEQSDDVIATADEIIELGEDDSPPITSTHVIDLEEQTNNLENGQLPSRSNSTHTDEIIELGEKVSPPITSTPVVDLEEQVNTYHLVNSRSSARIYVILVACIAFLGGVIIGDLVTVTGGLLDMSRYLITVSHRSFIKKLRAKETNFCVYSNWLIMIYSCTIQLSALLSLPLAYKLIAFWGRRPTLQSGVCSLLIGVCLITWFPNIYIDIMGMVLAGLGVGFIYQVVPTICSELAPEEARDKIEKLFQHSISCGTTLALALNFISVRYHVWGWRLSLGAIGIPAVFLLLASIIVSETPTFYILNNQLEEAEKAMAKIRGADTEVEFTELFYSVKKNQAKEAHREILKPHGRPLLVLTTVSTILAQLSGLNILILFGPMLIESVYDHGHEAFLAPLLIGVAGLVFAGYLSYILRFTGRRMVLIGGSLTSFFSLIGLWILFSLRLHPTHHLKKNEAYTTLSLVLLFALGSAALYGPHGWVNEAYPEETRVLGSAWLAGLTMLTGTLTTLVSFHVLCAFHEGIFIFYAAVSVIAACLIYFLVPETTGVKSHTIKRTVWRPHWFWKKYMMDDDESVVS